jgi:hypothetical protein
MESQQQPPPATPPPFVPGNFATVASNVFGVYYSNGVFTLSFRDLRDVGGRGAVIEVGRFATGPDGMAWLASMILAALRSYHEPPESDGRCRRSSSSRLAISSSMFGGRTVGVLLSVGCGS